MKAGPDFVHRGKTKRDLDCGKFFARRHGSSRTHDAIAAAPLLALLVVTIVTRAPISSEIADGNVERQSYVAILIDVVASLGLSIGLALLLFSSRPHADSEESKS